MFPIKYQQDCAADEACDDDVDLCVDPCTMITAKTLCGVGTRCDARNHNAVCSPY